MDPSEAHNSRKPAAQYLRMSTGLQCYSLEQQSSLIAKFAACEGFEIVRTYQDDSRSGLTASGRPGLKALLRDVIGHPPYSTILVLDVSRWGRFQDPEEAAHYEFICRDAGVQVQYCAEQFSNDGALSSNMMKVLKRMMAAEYSRQISYRCSAGIHRALQNGGKHGGPAPYGFQRVAFDPGGQDERKLRLGERKPRPGDLVKIGLGSAQEVATVRSIFAAFDKQGLTPFEIAQMLNRKGVPCSRPGPWCVRRVKNVLGNELAIGIRVSGRTRCYLGEVESVPSSDWIRTPMVKPIVAKAVFERVQKRLQQIGRNRHSDEMLLTVLRDLLAKHQRVSSTLIDRCSPVTIRTYTSRFGSLEAAYSLAGCPPSGRHGQRRGAWAREPQAIRDALARLFKAEGYLSASLINRTAYLPHSRGLVTRFGPLSDLFSSVGCDLTTSEKMKIIWERKRRQRASPDGAGSGRADAGGVANGRKALG